MTKDVVKYKVDSIEKLKEIGFHKIYEKTYISVSTLKKLLNMDFEDISPVHFRGFIRVLKREFPLINWEEYESNFNQKTTLDDEPKDLILKEIESEKRRKKVVLLSLFIVIIAILSIVLKSYIDKISVDNETTQIVEESNISNSSNANILTQEVIDKNITEQLSFLNESNTTKTLEKDDILIKKPNMLKVKAFEEVWLGRIMLDKKIKKSTVISANESVTFNGDRDQLLYFGHSQMQIHYKYGVIDPSHSKRSYYRYVNGDIEEISREKFIELNGGKVW